MQRKKIEYNNTQKELQSQEMQQDPAANLLHDSVSGHSASLREDDIEWCVAVTQPVYWPALPAAEKLFQLCNHEAS